MNLDSFMSRVRNVINTQSEYQLKKYGLENIENIEDPSKKVEMLYIVHDRPITFMDRPPFAPLSENGSVLPL